MLKEKIKEDVKRAMKAGDATRVGVLRLLQTAIVNKEIETRGRGETLTDDEIVQVLMTEAKKRRESIAVFEQGHRNDLAEKEKAELIIVQEYLPKQLGREELTAMVKTAMQRVGSKEFGAVMKEVMKEVKGRADGVLVSQVVKELLQ